MHKWLRYSGQAAAYALFIAVIGYFSNSPAYVHLAPDQALIKLSFSHAGRLRNACRKRTQEELAKLAPNMRAPLDCPRQRSPVNILLKLDGKPLYQELLPPAGLSRDGASTTYRRFATAAGRHHLAVRLNDSVRTTGYNYEREEDILLQPGQVFVIDFDAKKGGFIFNTTSDQWPMTGG